LISWIGNDYAKFCQEYIMMNSASDSLNPRYEECLAMRKWWVWILVLGLLLMVVGVAALSWDFIATVTTVLVFGGLLLAAGVFQIVSAFLARSWGGFFLHLLAALLHFIVGGIMIHKPLQAAAALTLMLAVVFLVEGAIRIVFVLVQRFSGWGWELFNGIVTFLLGLFIWQQWPEASYRIIGIFVGIDLLLNGWSWVMLGLAVRAIKPKSISHQPYAGPMVSAGAS
jgi:uncharacterized membrane protein HdeD (DUF308 family)